MSGHKKTGGKRKPWRLAGPRRQLVDTPLGLHEAVVAPLGTEGMSGVLARFIEPYVNTAHGEAAFRALVDFAMLAWNATLFPGGSGEETAHSLVDKHMAAATPAVRATRHQALAELIERKRTHFAGYKRLIVSVEVQPVGTGHVLTVVSTPDEP